MKKNKNFLLLVISFYFVCTIVLSYGECIKNSILPMVKKEIYLAA